MATHGQAAVEDEHEYRFPMPCARRSPLLTPFASYESLPPNFSLTANMMAGAFAGIAVGQAGACPSFIC
jgi:asparaginyl-tRNA synthetase